MVQRDQTTTERSTHYSSLTVARKVVILQLRFIVVFACCVKSHVPEFVKL